MTDHTLSLNKMFLEDFIKLSHLQVKENSGEKEEN